MKKRVAEIKRKTKETDISIKLNIDGKGSSKISYPVPFLAHMFDLFTKHGIFDLTLVAKGDIEVDIHHLFEDTGIALGEAFKKGLGDKKQIERYGHSVVVMDESLSEAKAAIDISGRPHLTFNADFDDEILLGVFKKENIQLMIDPEMLREFFEAFVIHSGIGLHIDLIRGKNTHHKIEAIYKAFGIALSKACAINPRKSGVPSTKGVL